MRNDLLDLLARAVASGHLSTAEAGAVLAAYDRGELPAELVRRTLPLPVAEAAIALTGDALADALYRLHLVAGLTAAQARSASLGGLVRVVEGRRARVLIRLTHGFEERTFGITRTLVRGGGPAGGGPAGSVSAWQRAMMQEIRSEVVGSASLGYGRAPTAAEARRIRAVLDSEGRYLRRFADEIAARRALAEATGDPSKALSEGYIRQRANQYGGAGRELFFRGMESRRGEGWVFDYESRDDPAVCSSCLAAEQGGPYLANDGPYPGTACKARGKCRCRRVARYSPEDYARLTTTGDGPQRAAA